MSEYRHVIAELDPLGVVRWPDGSWDQEIEITLTNDPDRDPRSLSDPVCSIHPERARELARGLLALAANAQTPRPQRGPR
jgi:hypothetical protein